MDAREQQRLDTVFRYHADWQLAELVRSIDGVKSQFAQAGRLNSEAYFQALIDAMGNAVHGFAADTHPAALKISKSYDACLAWQDFVGVVQNLVFADWEAKLAPPRGRYGQMNRETKAALLEAIAAWSDKIHGFLEVGSFDFHDPPPKRRPAIGLDGYPVPDSQADAPPGANSRPEPKPLPEARLVQWWNDLGPDRDLSLVKLLERARIDNPGHFISRERIRALAPGRKRGRRPIGGKATAE